MQVVVAIGIILFAFLINILHIYRRLTWHHSSFSDSRLDFTHLFNQSLYLIMPLFESPLELGNPLFDLSLKLR